jgi:hypothetical protein
VRHGRCRALPPGAGTPQQPIDAVLGDRPALALALGVQRAAPLTHPRATALRTSHELGGIELDGHRPLINGFDAINDVTTGVFDKRIAEGRRFAWRGVVNARWPLHSSLYRRHLLTEGGPSAPDEASLSQIEQTILIEVHRWGLHNGARGRLSIFEQLATLQHFGAPTRFVDVALNAYIGLWFAVEPKWSNGEPAFEDTDGRLFAIDITDRLINEDDKRRDWEDAARRPWLDLDIHEWCGKTWAWQPPPFEARIASQHGAFLFGGVPRTALGVTWPKTPTAGGGNWQLDNVRRSISLPLRLHKAEPEAGGVPAGGQPAYTYRIKAPAKAEIRARLGQVFGYTHRTIYPDYPGFAEFGVPSLKRW